MKGKLENLTFSRTGEQLITISVQADFREEFDELKEKDINVEIKKWSDRKSKNANDYCWVLCEKIAVKLSNDKVIYTKEDVYRESIRQVGVFKDRELSLEDAEMFSKAWSMIGKGWQTERVDFTPDGEKAVIRFYYGSSVYNTQQMSRLIDNLVQDCQALGISTATPNEIENLKSLWATAPKGKK